RSDLYSLGCVVYEMLAGSPPFSAGTVQALLAQRLVGPPPPLKTVPPAVNEVVRRSLATAPQDRFATALALADALVESASRPSTVQPSIVVLPFVNRSPDPDTEYFSDGLTDEVISDLSHVGSLRVLSRNSAMALKGTVKNTPTLAQELGVTHLVTGTVRRAGQSLRITAELVDAAADTPIWTEKFSGTMDDVFGFQEEIARRIVAALELRITGAEERSVAERPIDDPVAYDCYLRAFRLMHHWTPDAQTQAGKLVDQALGLTGPVPLLLAMKGQLEWNLVNIPGQSADGALERATALVDQALAIDPDCYLAIFVRGLVAGSRGQPEIGLVDLRRAGELRPGDGNVLLEIGRYSLSVGAPDSKEVVDRLVNVDPLTPQTHLMEAMYYGIFGPREKAAAPALRAIELGPRLSFLQISAAWWMAVAGRRAEALAILERVSSATTDLRGTFAT
ncbi:MAG: hypothetical protein R3246_14825, partial [Acidimicrobiia bacterium]|nr:hypothetical protein [Acidimicrobiia bacterium]